MSRGWRGVHPNKQASVITAIIGKCSEELTVTELEQLKQYLFIGDEGELSQELLSIARTEIRTWYSTNEGRIEPPRKGDTLGTGINSFAPDGMEDRRSDGKRGRYD